MATPMTRIAAVGGRRHGVAAVVVGAALGALALELPPAVGVHRFCDGEFGRAVVQAARAFPFHGTGF